MDPSPREKAFPGRRPRGRPRAENPRHKEIVVYCNADEKNRIAQKAREGNFNSVSDYLRSGGLRGWVRRIRSIILFDQHLGPYKSLADWARLQGRDDLADPAEEAIAYFRRFMKKL